METTKQKISILDHLHFDCPTSEQKTALLNMAEFVKEENTNDFFILCGAAGTGKSSITSALTGYLNDRELPYYIAAPTGRAARIIGRKTNSLNSTIHSMIYRIDSNPETGEVNFILKQNESADFTLFIIDEASMVSSLPNNAELSLFKSKNSPLSDLISFVKTGNKKNKIIFLGDRNQLPPISEKESLALNPDHLEKKFGLKGSVNYLTEVKRQEDGSLIMKNAITTRKAIEENRFTAPIEGNKFGSLNNAFACMANDFRNNGNDFCISIGATHKTNNMVNEAVRKILFGNAAKPIVKGDLMLVTQKWTRNGQELYNGDHVVVEEIDLVSSEFVAGLYFCPIKLKCKNLKGEEFFIDDYLMLDSIKYPTGNLLVDMEKKLRGDRYRKCIPFRESGNPSDDRYVGAIRLTYGYSITCNKAQGGEWEKVYMNIYFIPSLKYQYTAITRAVSNLVLY